MARLAEGQLMALDEWGPRAWGFLHACCYRYPESPTAQDKDHFHGFLANLGHVLPCPICRTHFQNFFKKAVGGQGAKARIFENRRNLANFMVDCHNDVNKRSNKPVKPYHEVERMYGTYVNPVKAPPSPTSVMEHSLPAPRRTPPRPATAARPETAFSRTFQKPATPPSLYGTVSLSSSARMAVVKDLQSRPDLNGKTAMLHRFDETSGRWGVTIEGERMSLPQSKLRMD